MTRMCEEIGPRDVENLIQVSPEATLKAVAMFGLERVLASVERTLLQRVVAESDALPEIGKRFWAKGPGQLEEFVAGHVAHAARRGVLDVKDPERAAERPVGLVTGMYLLPILVGGGKRPSRAEVDRGLDDVIAGFLAPLGRADRGRQ